MINYNGSGIFSPIADRFLRNSYFATFLVVNLRRWPKNRATTGSRFVVPPYATSVSAVASIVVCMVVIIQVRGPSFVARCDYFCRPYQPNKQSSSFLFETEGAGVETLPSTMGAHVGSTSHRKTPEEMIVITHVATEREIEQCLFSYLLAILTKSGRGSRPFKAKQLASYSIRGSTL